jgi:hypothetical protein
MGTERASSYRSILVASSLTAHRSAPRLDALDFAQRLCGGERWSASATLSAARGRPGRRALPRRCAAPR